MLFVYLRKTRSTTDDFTPTHNMSRATYSSVARLLFTPVAIEMQKVDTSLSLQAIHPTDRQLLVPAAPTHSFRSKNFD